MEHSHAEWLSITRQLIHRGYLVQDIATFSVLKLAPSALRVLKEGETVVLARPRVKETAKRKTPAAAMDLGPGDMHLFEALRELRKRLAAEAGVPPYVIFGDAALLEMSRARPRDEAEFLAINGVGQVKLARYGSAFLEAIAMAAAD
jgi:ATP-dependent DNA helicase RecQ